ncbi:MAG: diaminopimelate decarboxylase [Marinicaulis sp.]|nr:diaminopimelate decarboxylase [Marinicaulis sp.]
MHHFEYRSGRLHAEAVDLTALAETVGTPFYVYSEATLRRHIQVFQKSFADTDILVAYSVKANSNLAVLKVLASEGAGADVVSGGELKRALAAGIAPAKIVFSGVGKTDEEMSAALDAGIHQFNVESEPELIALSRVAVAIGKTAPIALRINPDVAAGGHAKISTGKSVDKFGVPYADAHTIFKRAATLPGIDVKGVDVHIGSQISELAPFEAAFGRVADLINTLRSDGITIERLDLGGGLGIPYGEGLTPPHPDAYGEMIKRITASLDVELIVEPGRMIVGNAGVLVSRVVYVKENGDRQFLILDAGMNDLLRPALYDAYHDIWPVAEPSGSTTIVYDVVGPVCESGDRFAASRALPEMREGDFVAILSAGAYGAVQASQYNSRPLTPEVLVNGDKHAIIRRRPSFEEMVALEETADWL